MPLLLPSPKLAPGQDEEATRKWTAEFMEYCERVVKHRQEAGYHYYPVKNKGQRRQRLYIHWLVLSRINKDGEELALIVPVFFAALNKLKTIPKSWHPVYVITTQGPAAVILGRAGQLISAGHLDQYCQSAVMAQTRDVGVVQKAYRNLMFGE